MRCKALPCSPSPSYFANPCHSLTGFKHNSVSPFGLKTDVPIIISKAVVEEEVSFMWMGGGDVDLKLGMGVGEFVKAKDAFVLDISEKRAM